MVGRTARSISILIHCWSVVLGSKSIDTALGDPLWGSRSGRRYAQIRGGIGSTVLERASWTQDTLSLPEKEALIVVPTPLDTSPLGD